MGLNQTPVSGRIHIGFFGRRNVGKSSLVNRLTGQEISIVSDVPGTTTDPVRKTMELLPLGPVLIIDTPGFDDEGELGSMRLKKTEKILDETDIAVLVTDARFGIEEHEKTYIGLFKSNEIPYIVVCNKCDIAGMDEDNLINVSANTGVGIDLLKNALGNIGVKRETSIVRQFMKPDMTVILVAPIDESAPKGRIILPQQQTIREILDSHARAIVVQLEEYESTLLLLKSDPDIVITDSQVFDFVSERTPDKILLTSFSVLLAAKKGFLEPSLCGAKAINSLENGDRILVSEACTHHRQCRDIGTVKIPRWLEKATGKKFLYDVSSGNDFPENLSQYKLIVHCGGCMINDRAMKARIKNAEESGVPIINYGILIAFLNGILERAIRIFT